MIAIAGILTGVGIFSSSFSQSLWQLYILYGLIAGSGMGGTTGALSGLASRWFDDKRGLALGRTNPRTPAPPVNTRIPYGHQLLDDDDVGGLKPVS